MASIRFSARAMDGNEVILDLQGSGEATGPQASISTKLQLRISSEDGQTDASGSLEVTATGMGEVSAETSAEAPGAVSPEITTTEETSTEETPQGFLFSETSLTVFDISGGGEAESMPMPIDLMMLPLGPAEEFLLQQDSVPLPDMFMPMPGLAAAFAAGELM